MASHPSPIFWLALTVAAARQRPKVGPGEHLCVTRTGVGVC